jgi:nucleotide-binding universal stress UspA family protein
VLVTTDLSPAAEPALEAAAELARGVGARVTLLHVTDLSGLGDSGAVRDSLLRMERDLRAEAKPGLEALCERVFKDIPLQIVFVESIGAAAGICTYARDHQADLIVIATHGRSGVKRFLIGSVAERVVHGAPCDVLTVRSRPQTKGD